jgi:hypothetical protein
MNNYLKSFTFLIIVNVNLCFCQSFINGDLDGIITGYSSLPTNWLNVPLGDPNCLAFQVGNDTPDLTSLTEPGPAVGCIGNPFSGSTFVSGAFASNPPNFFHEGIMQTVNGFTIGRQYSIHFRQTVVKTNYSLDKSGSWAVYVDTVLEGITTPTYSNEPYWSITLPWEARSINFFATATTHLIKFLPMDDDTNHLNSNTDTLGSLRMGIDSIGLSLVTGLEEVREIDFKVYPNPAKSWLMIEGKDVIEEIAIFSIQGQLIDRIASVSQVNYQLPLTHLCNGVYLFKIKTKKGTVNKRVMVMH